MHKFFRAPLVWGVTLGLALAVGAPCTSAWAQTSQDEETVYVPHKVKKYDSKGRHVQKRKSRLKKNKETDKTKSVQAVSEMRLVAQWFGEAYDIPARVAEEMFIAGYSYSDAVVALSLMDSGASLNEVLERRRNCRWDEVARKVDIDVVDLPERVIMVMNTQNKREPLEYVHFIPDVHSGLQSRMRLPSFAPTVPDPVCIERFHLSKEDSSNIRLVLENSSNLDENMLRLPAGRSLCTGDWVIAGTLAKYKPFPIETILAVRSGEVIEWGDVASMFSIDSKIFLDGPLAPIYAALIKGDNYATISTLRRVSYPKTMDKSYELSNVEGAEKQALAWLMNLHFKVTDEERNSLNNLGLDFVDQALSLAVARMAFVNVNEVAKRARNGASWKYLMDYYKLDLTGQDVIRQAALSRDKARALALKAEAKNNETQADPGYNEDEDSTAYHGDFYERNLSSDGGNKLSGRADV